MNSLFQVILLILLACLQVFASHYSKGLVDEFSLIQSRYIPQTCLNFRRKSVVGFSTTGIIVKHVGASFLFMNSLLTGGKSHIVDCI